MRAAAAATAPVTLLAGDFYWPSGPLGRADAALIGHLAAASLGSLLFFEIIRMAGVVFMSQVAYIVTVTGILWGMYFFDESHSSWIWAAFVVIVIGVALVSTPSAKRSVG